ncbi:MAG: GGDEF domain-containing protein [Syntrophobacteraceae bacterium]
MRILVADQSRTSRMILAAVLKDWGFTPVLVSDGNAAWEIVQYPGAPRLAILEWSMPGINGLEVCRQVRRLNIPEPPYIILLTSRGREEDILSGLEAGADDYFAKPYDNAELYARIKVGRRVVEMQAEMNRVKSALIYEAAHDPLTSTLNRGAILNVLEKEFTRSLREGSSLSIGLLDIDHFKKINDTFGHRVGDEVLCALVRLIESNIRIYDCVGRYGGEKFLLITPGKTDTTEKDIYERLFRVIRGAQLQTGAGPLSLEVSAGVACRKEKDTVESLLDASAQALYRARLEGCNRISYAP